MSDTGEDRRTAETGDFRAIERLIAEHPAHREYVECDVLRRSIIDVYMPNLRELMASLERASNEQQLAFELIQNVRPPVVRDSFYSLLSRQIHNYLASALSLVDHVRRIMRHRTGNIADEFARRKAEVVSHPEIAFVQDLRNYTMHRSLPFFAHSLNLTNINTPDQKMKSEVELGTKALLMWDGWSGRSQEFLAQAGEAVELRPVIQTHGALISSLNIWLHNELSAANERELGEVNRLIAARNAALAGVDIATAERLTRDGLGGLASPVRLSSSD